MEKYRKKPLVIEAEQITKESFFPRGRIPGVIYNLEGRFVEVHTLEGIMRGNVGDWIIRGVEGELYPCKNSVFEATYKLEKS